MSDRSNLFSHILYPGKVRAMARSDFDQVILIEGQTEFESVLSVAGLKIVLESKTLSALVVDSPECPGYVVAYAIFERHPLSRGNSRFEIYRLGVGAQFQRKHYGLQLLQHIRRRLNRKGDRLTWLVRQDDPRAKFLARVEFGRAIDSPSYSSLPDRVMFVHEFPGESRGWPPRKTCREYGWE